jgi:hypothetical protein
VDAAAPVEEITVESTLFVCETPIFGGIDADEDELLHKLLGL